MRPVRLELDGFGSFRDPTVIDFDQSDYFALVGPTGSGKSTVIDALTFALYGSVPRWDDRRTVGLALSPSVTRGTVKLVFDVGADRYVIARELRRTKAGVGIKNARLDRLHDSRATGLEGDSAESVAADSLVNPAIEGLLGLTFEHFCTCVVLPQGDFAEFLHKKPSDREKLLSSLLGLDVYSDMMRHANSLVSQHESAAKVQQQSAAQLSDATIEAVSAAQDRAKKLTELKEELDGHLDKLQELQRQAETDADALLALKEQHGRVSVVHAPDDLEDLGAKDTATAAALAGASKALELAEAADETARAAVADGPHLAEVSQVLQAYAALESNNQALPAAQGTAKSARTALAETAHQLKHAEKLEEQARNAAAKAQKELETAERERAEAASGLQHLRATSAPSGLDDLESRTKSATDASAAAVDSLSERQAEDDAARDALAHGPDKFALQQVQSNHQHLQEATDRLAALETTFNSDLSAHSQARDALRNANERLTAAQQAKDAEVQHDLAAALRPHLHVGDACPVCEQTVAMLPTTTSTANIEAAEQSVKVAVQGVQAATKAEREAARRTESAAQLVTLQQEKISALRTATESTTMETVTQELKHLDDLHQKADAARALLQHAQKVQREAARVLNAANRDSKQAATALHAARDPLVSLGAPPVGENPVTGWRDLLTWVKQAIPDLEERADTAQEKVDQAALTVTATKNDLVACESETRRLQKQATDDALADQEATRQQEQLTKRIQELTAQLQDAPSQNKAQELETLAHELAKKAHDAQTALTQARKLRNEAANARTELDTQLRQARAGLNQIRDTLVPLGAPALAGKDLQSDWKTLMDWAQKKANKASKDIEQAQTVVTKSDAAANHARVAIASLLQKNGLQTTTDFSATEAAAVAAAAQATATSAAEHIAARHDELESLNRQIEKNLEDAQVAKMIGSLLRTNAFPRWLIGSALDVLVADASAYLHELSGGQFDLIHEDGIFYVIDHTDVESKRPVKTLSGGETFQASLSLALALSAHLSNLATDGTARLDAIFLDEGFGTLDDAMLEIVAATLENLANHGDRMVGLVTHVKSLAERVPIRYEVTRDQRSSHIQRVGG